MSTISPWPAPTVSTTTKVRPAPTKRSRFTGSTRNGSTVSSLRPVIEATLCVATTRPVTRARNIAHSRFPEVFPGFQQLFRLTSHDELLVRRHDPQLHAAIGRVNGRLAL